MIPIRLHMRNFMCYTDVHEPLQFDGIHVACISGDNGHGKSTLLDAITWALWGECRSHSADELIHLGATEMEVEFEFQLGDGRYRVLRRRSRAGRGQTALELHSVLDDGTLRPLTGGTMRETQERIVDLLGLTYDTFINSSFLLQGRADEFTVKPPGERKRILAEILELGRYDELEARAREAMKARETAVAEADRDLAAIDAELARRPEHEAELDRLERRHAELDREAEHARLVVEALKERKARGDRARAELAAAERRVADGRQQLARAERQAAEHRDRIAQHEAVLAQADQIEAGYERLREARAAVEALNDKAAAALDLEKERSKQQRAVERARSALEATLRTLDQRLPALEAAAARRPQLAADLEAAEAAAARFEALQRERKEHEQTLHGAAGEKAGLEEANKQLRKQFQEVRAHRRELEEAAQCPFCLSPLDGPNRDHALARCDQRNAELQAQGQANNARIAELDAIIAGARERLAAVEAEAAPLASAAGRAGSLRQALEHAEQAAAELDGVRAERERTAARLAAGDYAPEAQAALRAVEARLAALAYDADEHAARRKEVAALEPWEARYHELVRAREALPQEQQLLRAAEEAIKDWQDRLAQDEAQVEALRAELGDADALLEQLGASEAELRRLEQELRECDQQLGRVKQILTTLDFQAQERERRAAQRARLQEERGIYAELATAFGKRGIQAMIIENVIPELEAEANALLARMTDGRMHLKLETQRDTRQGNTIETLDIKLADELGTRRYELFSGGEAFRANFALRIALSKLVARRAGARVELLVVDEGFGTQDAEGLERLVEAIKAIQDDFAKVLVITHIPEMKEVFPCRIEVRKTPRGSVYQVV